MDHFLGMQRGICSRRWKLENNAVFFIVQRL